MGSSRRCCRSEPSTQGGHVPLQECKAWPSGTGLALRDWLRSKGIEPPMLEIPKKTRAE